ncbi:MAG: DUF4125 family protein [Ignavibacteriaceae bacterium]|jgi:hypothetical protein|nr:DUF4125 family protein [Ignavibacteriaceae bacterium]
METLDNVKETLIKDIIQIEWEMFSSVNASEPNSCQEDRKTFQLMRWMSYSAFDEKLLKSFLENLKQAKEDERNLMTEKYGKMEGIIPHIEESHDINQIADAEQKWMKEVSQKYPLTFPANPNNSESNFTNYLKCELETYSEDTLSQYAALVKNSLDAGKNLVEERYNNLFVKMGYNSLADKESKEKQKEFWKNNTNKGC